VQSPPSSLNIFAHKDGDSMYLQNVGIYVWVQTASQPRGT
jgi:hypothetical protein